MKKDKDYLLQSIGEVFLLAGFLVKNFSGLLFLGVNIFLKLLTEQDDEPFEKEKGGTTVRELLKNKVVCHKSCFERLFDRLLGKESRLQNVVS